MTQHPLRIGLIARADNTGLGNQTYEFYRHMKPTKTMVVDISKFNGNQQYPERYNKADCMFIEGFPQDRDVDKFLEGLDVVFIAEAAYNPYLYIRAKQLGVKTANQYNYEFFEWYHPGTPTPDLFIAPSKWHFEEVDQWCHQNGIKHTYLHCPVNRELLPFREIRQAKTFLHTAGRAAALDRNGTETVIAASAFVQSDVNIIVHFQGHQGLAHQSTSSIEDYYLFAEEHGDQSKLTISVQEYPNYTDIYSEGDVLLLPRRYGGNCLPVNEALSVGMPAIMTRISPNTELLPESWLVNAFKKGEFTPRTTVGIYESPAQKLAKKIDWFANLDEEQMLRQNAYASNIAQTISWEALKWEYQKVLEELCTQ